MSDLQAMQQPEAIARVLRSNIGEYQFSLRPVAVGTVMDVGDGIAHISGLYDAMVGEMLLFADDTLGMALNLEENAVGAIILGDARHIVEGSSVRATGNLVSVPVGLDLLGRVVDPLGRPLDGKGPVRASRVRPVEWPAARIIDRAPVNEPLQTGIKAIDALVPIGRGQRELIIGDRQTGKTTIALDTILNQHRDDVLCLYVAIGQRLSTIAQVVNTLERNGALEHTIVVAADASAPAALQYIAPYAGCAMGEDLMYGGRDVLIIYDDLTKHAWAYRQISLLLRRPPGREAYPGDLFYLHSRLLERAAHLDAAHGGGSLTALPIVETQLGDLAAYVPTNIISITDGQIFLEEELFHSGTRPAINAGLSVSRVGGAAQVRAMKSVAGQLHLELAQYREMAVFAQFGTEIDQTTQLALERGSCLREVLKQGPHRPVAMEDQVALYYAVTRGHLDDVPLGKVTVFERQFLEFLRQKRQALRQAITIQRELSEQIESMLVDAITDFKQHDMVLGD
jgi:F-type H+-transporting ATPase subunit alpha